MAGRSCLALTLQRSCLSCRLVNTLKSRLAEISYAVGICYDRSGHVLSGFTSLGFKPDKRAFTGLTEDGEVVCTGEFASISRTPAGKFVQIATGPQYACALTNKGLATCWVRILCRSVFKNGLSAWLSVKGRHRDIQHLTVLLWDRCVVKIQGRAFDRSDRMGTVTKAFADLNLVAIRPSWEDAPFENACGITRDGRLVCSDDANPAVSNFTTSLPASFRAQQLCMGVGFLCMWRLACFACVLARPCFAELRWSVLPRCDRVTIPGPRLLAAG